jgi:Uma2 family endonuclease
MGMGEPAPRISVEEYLALDAASDLKHEYLNGAVVAMAGASPRHNQVASNVFRHLGNALETGPCRIWSADQRVRVSATGAYTYPDLVVVCAEPRFADDHPASLLNPRLLVEVLSPSTRDYDRSAKLAHYRQLPSVREVLLVEANEPRAELYGRLDDGRWLITDYVKDEIELTSVDARLTFAAIYAKTDGLPAED